jgi:hypothetical protein
VNITLTLDGSLYTLHLTSNGIYEYLLTLENFTTGVHSGTIQVEGAYVWSINATIQIIVVEKYSVKLDSTQTTTSVFEGNRLGLIASLTDENGTPYQQFEVTFDLTITYANETVISSQLKSFTNLEGRAETSYLLPLDVTRVEVIIIYSGDLAFQSNSSTLEITVVPNLPLRVTLLFFNPYPILTLQGMIILGAVGFMILLAMYFSFVMKPRKQKLGTYASEQRRKYAEILGLRHLIILHADSNMMLHNIHLRGTQVQTELVSGLLGAIDIASSCLLLDQNENSEIKLQTIDYGGFKVVFDIGQYIKGILLLEIDEPPSIWLKDRLAKFVTTFEKQHQEVLKTWKGDLSSLNAGEIRNLFFEEIDYQAMFVHTTHQVSKLTRDEQKVFNFLEGILANPKEQPFIIPVIIKEVNNKFQFHRQENLNLGRTIHLIESLRKKGALIPTESLVNS